MKFIFSIVSLVSLINVAKTYTLIEKFPSDYWTYHDLDAWPELCNIGTEQSPIHLETAVSTREIIPEIEFHNYENEVDVDLVNNGFAVELRISQVNGTQASFVPYIEGGVLEPDYNYTLDSVHFHWNAEHVIDNYRCTCTGSCCGGIALNWTSVQNREYNKPLFRDMTTLGFILEEQYPLEAHFVHYNASLGNISNAINYRHGYAVVGVMFQVMWRCEENIFDDIIAHMGNISQNVNTPIRLLNKVKLSSFLSSRREGFFVYNGSLTTPDCNEGALWTVYEGAGCIEETQLRQLRNIYTADGDLVVENVRPVQNLNDRQILYRSSAMSVRISAVLWYMPFLFYALILK